MTDDVKALAERREAFERDYRDRSPPLGFMPTFNLTETGSAYSSVWVESEFTLFSRGYVAAFCRLASQREDWEQQFHSAASAASEYSEFWEQHHGKFDQFGNYLPHSQIDGDLRAAKAEIERLKAQREDVIDREAIVRIIQPGCLLNIFPTSWDYFNWKARRDMAFDKADAIIRSLPSREAIIEAVKAKIDARMNDRLIDLKPEMDDSITGFNDAWTVVDTAIRSLAAQPRSNRVEVGAETPFTRQFKKDSAALSEKVGAGRNSPQKAVIGTEQPGHVPSPASKGI